MSPKNSNSTRAVNQNKEYVLGNINLFLFAAKYFFVKLLTLLFSYFPLKIKNTIY